MSLTAGQTYAFVIGGGVGGNASGGYRLEDEGALRSSCRRRSDRDVVGSWSDDARVFLSDVISTVGTWTKSSSARAPRTPSRATLQPRSPQPPSLRRQPDLPVALDGRRRPLAGQRPLLRGVGAGCRQPGGQPSRFDALADRTYGDAPIMLDATASSGLAVSYRVFLARRPSWTTS